MTELETFFSAMWALFLDGCTIDGVDLQNAILKSGLGEPRIATAADIGDNSDYQIGDDFVGLTEAGMRAVKAP